MEKSYKRTCITKGRSNNNLSFTLHLTYYGAQGGHTLLQELLTPIYNNHERFYTYFYTCTAHTHTSDILCVTFVIK